MDSSNGSKNEQFKDQQKKTVQIGAKMDSSNYSKNEQFN